MTEQPTKIHSNLEVLRKALAKANEIVFDFETSDVRPREASLAGMGIFVPTSQRAFYINIGHMQHDPMFPQYASNELAEVLSYFFGEPSHNAIAHNASYDLRCLFKLGVDVRCRITCTLINAHRLDENIRQFGKEPTYHDYCNASYGLKELTTILFDEQPPSLHETIGRTNVLFSSVTGIAKYCVLDCWNTWRLHERTQQGLHDDHRLGSGTE